MCKTRNSAKTEQFSVGITPKFSPKRQLLRKNSREYAVIIAVVYEQPIQKRRSGNYTHVQPYSTKRKVYPGRGLKINIAHLADTDNSGPSKSEHSLTTQNYRRWVVSRASYGRKLTVSSNVQPPPSGSNHHCLGQTTSAWVPPPSGSHQLPLGPTTFV